MHTPNRSEDVYHARSHEKYFVFAGQVNGTQYRILVRPLTKRQNAIVFISLEPGPVTPEAGIERNGRVPAVPQGSYHPNVLKSSEVLRREAKEIFFKNYPRLKEKAEVWHRFPLKWRRLFPKADPNRLSNLIGLSTAEQRREVKVLWETFEKACRGRRKNPTPKELWKQVYRIDRVLFSP